MKERERETKRDEGRRKMAIHSESGKERREIERERESEIDRERE